MKFIHISDLHLGKTIYGVSLIDSGDQTDWVTQFLDLSGKIQPDAVVIAGDIYDRSAPSGEAVLLFDRLLTGLSEMDIPVMVVAGNHDSGERLSFARNLLSKNCVYIAGQLERTLTSVTISSRDNKEEITFWLMPYLFPALVSHVLEDDSIRDYDTAVRRLLEQQNIDFSKKNVLIAHQNVTAFGKEAERGGSESMVGGVGQIDYSAFDGFTYVALGHIHSAYPVGRPEVRYAGSPLCYHFDEIRQSQKGPLLVEIDAAGTVTSQVEVLQPLHSMRRLEDSYENILQDLLSHPRQKEFLRIVLMDQKITPEISSYLRELCRMRGSVLMELLSEHTDYSQSGGHASRKDTEEKSIEELFVQFYEDRCQAAEPTKEEMGILSAAGDILRRAPAQTSDPSEEDIQKLLQFALTQEE